MIKERKYNFGDIVRAKCTAIGRALLDGKCLYVGAMCNELCVDDIDMDADWGNPHNLPLPEDDELKRCTKENNWNPYLKSPIEEPNSISNEPIGEDDESFKSELKVYMQRFLRDFGMANSTINDAIDFNMEFLNKEYFIVRKNTPNKMVDKELSIDEIENMVSKGLDKDYYPNLPKRKYEMVREDELTKNGFKKYVEELYPLPANFNQPFTLYDKITAEREAYKAGFNYISSINKINSAKKL